jgi:hypothetical protein
MAFAHHKAQEKIEKRPHRDIDRTGEKPALTGTGKEPAL